MSYPPASPSGVETCVHCGSQNAAGALACPSCGRPVERAPLGSIAHGGASAGTLGPATAAGTNGVRIIGGPQADYAHAPFTADGSAPRPATGTAPPGGPVPHAIAGPAGPDLGGLTPALAGYQPAAIGSRIIAGAIDQLVFVALAVAGQLGTIVLLSGSFANGLKLGLIGAIWLLVVAVIILFWRWMARRGLSLGKRVAKVRLVSATTGRAPGWGSVASRDIVLWALTVFSAGIAGIITLLSPLWDKTGCRRSWHDKASGLVLIAAAELPAVSADFTPEPMADVVTLFPDGAYAPAGQPPAGAAGAAGAAGSPWAPSGTSTPGPAGIGQPEPFAPPAHAAPPMPATPPTQVTPPTQATPPLPTNPPAPVAGQPAPFAPPSTDPAGTTGPRVTTGPTVEYPSVAAVPTVQLVFEDGYTVDVRGVVLLGRNPEGAPDEHVDIRVPWHDDSYSMSKTHAMIRVDGDHLVVTDRNSTNGTSVILPDGGLLAVLPGQPVTVPVGSTVRCGDRRISTRQIGR